MTRILTAAALIPVIVYVVLWSNSLVFLAVLIAAAFLCWREYDSIAAEYGFGAPGPIGLGAGMALLFLPADTWLLIGLVAAIALVVSMRSDDLAKALPRASLLLMGIVYVFAGWRSAIPLREMNPHWLLFALLVNWAGDTGAYFAGRAFGKHKLAPVVSPKKTWEGAVASVVASVVVAGGYVLKLIPDVPAVHVVVLAILANIAGQLGDLVESTMKRGAGVKDSGAILPGHGGFLDRVDSTLFALPVTYAYLRFFLYYMGR